MKIFNTEQIKKWDTFTIQEQDISSLELMERASKTFVKWFTKKRKLQCGTIYIFCGKGNNGGDGLAIARLLHKKKYRVKVVLLAQSGSRSIDNQTNLKAVEKIKGLQIITISKSTDFSKIRQHCIIIDALFGTGLKDELADLNEKAILLLNQINATRIAIDIPSGLLGDKQSTGVIFKADYTFAFEQPKLAFLFPEYFKYVGKWICHGIALSDKFYNNENTVHHFLNGFEVSNFIKTRTKFEHKGNFGHALLIMGSHGKIGAAVLSTFACLRAGCGLATIYTPACGYEILQSTIPEAMVIADKNKSHISQVPKTDNYNAIGIGCGLGTGKETQKAFGEILRQINQPLVLDADALNIISLNPDLLSAIPKNSILSPHPKEFERLFGKTSNSFERNRLQREKSISLHCYIVLKGAYTCTTTPVGGCYYNTSGNPGMATAGSGDVLTGIITSFLAQGYDPKAATLLSVYIHGMAGDLAAKKLGEASLIARDIIKYLPKALLNLYKFN